MANRRGGGVNRIKERWDPVWYGCGVCCGMADPLVVATILAVLGVIGWGWPIGMLLIMLVALGLVVKHGRERDPAATELH